MLPDVPRGLVSDILCDAGERRDHYHMVEQFGGFGNTRRHTEAGGGGNIAVLSAIRDDDWLAGAHHADGDPGGLAGGGIAQVDAAIDGCRRDPEVGFAEVPDAVDGGVGGFGLHKPREIGRHCVSCEEERHAGPGCVQAAKRVD